MLPTSRASSTVAQCAMLKLVLFFCLASIPCAEAVDGMEDAEMEETIGAKAGAAPASACARSMLCPTALGEGDRAFARTRRHA